MDTMRGALVAACLALAIAAGLARADSAATSSVTLVWTAPGDDGYEGQAARYDLRYSLSPITEQNFDRATAVPLAVRPAAAGIRQRTRVEGLQSNRAYYFALKSVDDAGNWSLISNVTYLTAPDPNIATSQFPISLSAPYPSPARDYMRCEMTLPRTMVVHVNLIDIGGRQVKTLAEGHYPAGTSMIAWDLVNGNGARLAVGQYWLVGVLGDQRFTRRVTVIP
jgi:hypothetical protein